GVQVGQPQLAGQGPAHRGGAGAAGAVVGHHQGGHCAATRQPRSSSAASSLAAAAGITDTIAIPTFCFGECSIWKSSMFTPTSPTSENSRPSSPGSSGTSTLTSAYRLRVPPCLPGTLATPSFPAPITADRPAAAPRASGPS